MGRLLGVSSSVGDDFSRSIQSDGAECVARFTRRLRSRWLYDSFAMMAFVLGVVFALAGALFGPLWGSLWNLTDVTFGATLALLIPRYVARDWIARRSGGPLKAADARRRSTGPALHCLCAARPYFPFNLSNDALGLTGSPLHHYVIATFVCMAPSVVAYGGSGMTDAERLAAKRMRCATACLHLVYSQPLGCCRD